MSVGNDPLQALLRGRGAVMVNRRGASVAAHFGSAAGELAACVRGVGIANRSDLGKLVVTGPYGSVQTLARRHVGVELARRGVAELPEGWWCADEVDRLLVFVTPGLRAEMYDRLGQEGRALGIRICDASENLASVTVAGRRMRHLLVALGIVAPNCDLRRLAPFSPVEVEGSPVHLLLQSDHRALLIMDGAHAEAVWQALETAGRPLGLSLVGLDALERFALVEKMQVDHTASA